MLFSRWVAFSALAFFMVIIITARKVSKTQWSTDASFYCIATDAILDEIAIFKNVTNNIIDCIDFCISIAVCKAINTHKRTDGKIDCHLLQEDHMTSNKVISKPGWRLYDTGSSDTNSAIGSKCSTKPSNPCSVGCACVDTNEGHRCDCDNVTKTVFPSCKAALHQNNMAELYYFIKRGDMAEAVYVNCTKNSEGFYVATFDHKNETRTLVNGYEPCGSYIKSLDYSPNNITAIAAYIEAAASCRQFTKLECRGTLFMTESDCAHSYSRSGVRLNYWGGGPTDGIGCACGITNSCYNTGNKCNCDANAAAELVDEGYMTDKAVLPITEVRFGDTGYSDEYIKYTIGKLECIEN